MGQSIVLERNLDLESPEHPPPPRIARPRLSHQQIFGISMRVIRDNRGLSLEDVTGATGVSGRVVELIEEGKDSKTASIRDVEKIAETLSCSLAINRLKKCRAGMKMDTVFAKGGRPKLKPIRSNVR